jgi:hypothetical protein
MIIEKTTSISNDDLKSLNKNNSSQVINQINNNKTNKIVFKYYLLILSFVLFRKSF